MNNHKLGFIIPNSDFDLNTSRIIVRYDYLFVITTDNEILVFEMINNEYRKKFMLLTHPQEREEILDIFVLDKASTILDVPQVTQEIIVTISKDYIIHYWNSRSGKCIAKINLSKDLNSNNNSIANDFLLGTHELQHRFILFIFSKKLVIFDSCTQTIAFKNPYNFDDKNKSLKDLGIVSYLKVKDNKFFVYSNLGNVYYLWVKLHNQLKHINDVDSDEKDRNSDPEIDSEEEEYDKNLYPEYHMYLLEKTKNIKNTNSSKPIKKKANMNSCYTVISNTVSFDYEKIELIFYKTNFDPEKQLNVNSENYKRLLSKKEQFFIFTDNNQIKVSFLDSDDKLSVISQRKLSYSFSKSKIIYLGEISLLEESFILVIYSNYHSDLLYYDQKVRDVKLITRFNLMLEKLDFRYKFYIKGNRLFVYQENNIYIYLLCETDLPFLNDEENSDFTALKLSMKNAYIRDNDGCKLEDRYNDTILDLNFLFNKKINFTNYFKDNFTNLKQCLLKELNDKKQNYYNDKNRCYQSLLKNSENKYYPTNEKENNAEDKTSFSYSTLYLQDRKNSFVNFQSYNTEKKKRSKSITNEYFSLDQNSFKITSSIIFYNKEDFSTYYIIGFDCGLIVIIDVFFDKSLNISPYYYIDYHQTKIKYLSVYSNSILISGSEDGKISFTDISNTNLVMRRIQHLEEMKIAKKNDPEVINNSDKNKIRNNENIEMVEDNLVLILLDPSKTIDCYNELERVIPVIQINKNSLIYDEMYQKTNKNYIALLLKNNNAIIVNLFSFKTAFNLSMNTKEIIGVYLNASSKMFMFLLANFWLKVCSMGSRNVDRVVKNSDTINKMLRVQDTLNSYFNASSKVLINDFDNEYLNPNEMINNREYQTQQLDFIHFNNPKKRQSKLRNYSYDKSKVNNSTDINYQEEKPLEESHNEVLGFTRTFKSRLIQIFLKGNYADDLKSSNKSKQPIDIDDKRLSINNFNEAVKIYYTKYIHNLYNRSKMYLNFCNNKFDASKLKTIENLITTEVNKIINDVISIDHNNINNKSINQEYLEYINSFSYNSKSRIDFANTNLNNLNYYNNIQTLKLSVKEEAKFKKLKLFNLLHYPTKHFLNTFEDYSSSFGVDSLMMNIGNQMNQLLEINFEDFFLFLERVYHEMKFKNTFLVDKHNIFNLLSLMRIWNISIDQDILFLENFKIFHPIFDFNIVLYGCESSLTIILNEEAEVSGGTFATHYNILKREYLPGDDKKRKEIRDREKIFDKRHAVNHQSGYCVNFKNYCISGDVSHMLNIIYFGSLVSILGYEEGEHLTKMISMDKLLLRSLSMQSYIKFSNLNMLQFYIFDGIDSTTIADKDIIVIDYFLMKLNSDNKKHGKTHLQTGMRSTVGIDNKALRKSMNVPQKLNSTDNNENMVNQEDTIHNVPNSTNTFNNDKTSISSYLSKPSHSNIYSTTNIINTINKPIINNLNLRNSNITSNLFLKQVNNLINYINSLYVYLFDLNNLEEATSNFEYSKEKSIDMNKEKVLSEFDLLVAYLVITFNHLSTDKLHESIIEKTSQIIILFIFKILKDQELKTKYCKTVVELLSKSSVIVEKIFRDSPNNYLRILTEMYCSIRIPIDLEGLFKKYEIGNCVIIKSEDNLNFLKIMIAKVIKSFSKSKVNVVLKFVIEEFKNYGVTGNKSEQKTGGNNFFNNLISNITNSNSNRTDDVDRYNYLLEILWIIFKEKNYKHINYLPSLIHLIMK